MKAIIRILQFCFAVTFLFSGLAKCIDPAGTAIKLSEYLQYFGLYSFTAFAMPLSWLLCLVEAFCGVTLLVGRWTKLSLLLSTGMMLVFTPLTFWLMQSGAIQDCGCFGDALHLSNAATFAKNVVLCLVLIMLWRYRRHFYRWRGSRLCSLFISCEMLLMVCLCLCGTVSEPYIDFRPFTPGTDLRQAVLTASEQSQAYYTCIYAKDGVQQEFALEDLPDESDGWEFVETIEHQAQAGQSALDFFVKLPSGEVYTESLLRAPGYTFLLLSASLHDASQHDIDRIEQLYEYAEDNSYPFYCLTARDRKQYDDWCYNTGAEYDFLFTDATIVQTICRSNPCVMLLRDGVICWKKPLAELNTQDLTSAKLNEQSWGEIEEITPVRRFSSLMILLFAPFIIYLLVKIPQKVNNKSTKKDSKDA